MNPRIIYFDVLRVLAILAVITIHVAYPSFANPNHSNFNWQIANIYTILTHWAVPIFFMISGALLLKKDEPIATFFARRFTKIIKPFIFWDIVYSFIVALTTHKSVLDIIVASLKGSVFYHLWFVYALLGVYLMVPILRTFIKNASKNSIEYFLILWFFITGVNPLLSTLFHFEFAVLVQYLFGYIGYFVLGYYLHHFEINKNGKVFIYFLALFGLILEFAVTGFQDNNSFSVICLSAAIFIAFKEFVSDKFTLFNTVNTDIGRLCFGIYFIHPIFLALLKANPIFRLDDTFVNELVGIPVTVFTAFCFSAIFYILLDYVAKRNKYIKTVSNILY